MYDWMKEWRGEVWWNGDRRATSNSAPAA